MDTMVISSLHTTNFNLFIERFLCFVYKYKVFYCAYYVHYTTNFDLFIERFFIIESMKHGAREAL